MKHLLILAITAIGLSACSSTWHGVKHGVKEDTANNIDNTREAVRKGSNAVGRGISHVGEKIENATE